MTPPPPPQVHLRSEPLAIGKLALNLFGFSASEPSLPGGIAAAMALLLPRAHRVGLSLATLNAAPFAPRKDYTSDRLVTGVLQLAEGTHLTLDETELASGQLSAVGVGNVESLKTLIEWQKVLLPARKRHSEQSLRAEIQFLGFGFRVLGSGGVRLRVLQSGHGRRHFRPRAV